MTVPLHELAYEVELKFRLAEDSDLDQLLSTVPVARGPVVDQCDTYLAHPGRDFAVTDEAFRIRSMGDDNRLTYKGPLVDRETKTRQEVEVPFESGGPAPGRCSRCSRHLDFVPSQMCTSNGSAVI